MTEDQKAAERADFENHIRGRYGNYVLLERYANTYALPKFAEAWQAWQARAALAQPEPTGWCDKCKIETGTVRSCPVCNQTTVAQPEPVADGEVAKAAKYIREHGVSGLGRYDRNQIADLLERTEAARRGAEENHAAVVRVAEQRYGENNDLRKQLAAERGRLDFVLNNQAFIHKTETDIGGEAYQLWAQDENEEYHSLTGPGFYSDPHTAINAAIQAEKGQQDD